VDQYGGYRAWRLPTVEEAMSLVDQEKKNEELHIHPAFNPTQRWIWTIDKRDDSYIWVVNFTNGRCYNDQYYTNYFVRSVRSGINHLIATI